MNIKKLALMLVFVLSSTLFAQEMNIEEMKKRFEEDGYKLNLYNKVMNNLNDVENDYNRVEILKIREELKSLLYYSLKKTKKEFYDKYVNNNGSQDTNNGEIPANYQNLKDGQLVRALYENVKGHKVLGYRGAREAFFSDIDNENGMVECYYTGRKLKTNTIPNHTTMNCEHSWPQSFFNKRETERSDIHHLFPTMTKSNSMRSSYLYGKVVQVKWQENGSKLGRDASGRTVFEPRDEVKGDIARAQFYFAVRYYNASVNSGGGSISKGENKIHDKVEAILREWHKQDPVSAKEKKRNDGIEKHQKNRNPFVDYPSLVGKISNF